MPKCGACRKPTTNKVGLKTLCGIDCAIEYGRQQRTKRERRELAADKARIKTLPQLVKEAQTAFNAYIRARDYDLPCISCGDFTPMTRGGDYDCGHYRSVGANPELRFHEQNANKQCKRCNGHLSGNIVNYRIGLLMKYGEAIVAEIEGPHEPLKLKRQDLIDLRAEYKAKLKAITNLHP